MARALVTGGAGFLGSHLCDRLLAEGLDVIAMDNLITGSLDNLAHLETNTHFTYVKHDVIEPICVEGLLDYVFHLASPASPVDFFTRPKEILKVNAWGTERTLDLAQEKGARFFSQAPRKYTVTRLFIHKPKSTGEMSTPSVFEASTMRQNDTERR